MVQRPIFTDDLPELTEPHEKVFKDNGKIKTKFYNREFMRLQYEMVNSRNGSSIPISGC